MDKKQSETLAQQKKARKEFLELKKMQSGKIPAPPKPSEEAIVPKTFGDKLKNFWFHYKTPVILIVFLCVVLVIGISQCVSRTDYDVKVLLYTENYYTESQINVFQDYIKQYAPDINGNGKTEVQIINCSYSTSGTYDYEYVSALAAKMQATVASDGSVQLFIVDEAKKTQLDNISEKFESFFTDETKVDGSLYSLAENAGEKLPENLIIGKRVTAGTSVENYKNIEKFIETANDILNRIKEK